MKAAEDLYALDTHFDTATLADWKRQIELELKGGQYSDRMHYRLRGGLVAEAVGHPETQVVTPGYLAPERADWVLQQSFVLAGDLVALNRLILQQLVQGTEAICLRLPYHEAFLTEPERDYLPMLETVLNGVLPGYIAISFHAGMQGSYVLGAYIKWLQQHGHDPATVTGAFLWDPYTLAAWSGHWDDADVEQAKDFGLNLQQLLPGYSWQAVDGYFYNACGATGVQELAYALCALLELGQPNSDNHLHLRLASSRNLMTEVAKLRAVRSLWQRLAQQYRPELTDTPIRLTVVSALWPLAQADPHNNLVRNTLQAIAGVWGGADYLDLQPYNQLNELNDAFGLRLAKNIQLLLKEESHQNQVIDPTAGSYTLEQLTHATLEAAHQLAAEILATGGLATRLKTSKLQNEMAAERERLISRFDTGSEVIVGVNKYKSGEEQPAPVPAFRPAVAQPNIERITPIRLG
ncbi:MAG: methylmalonyl-CoA mutase family protein [Sphingobacteriia bacterium]